MQTADTQRISHPDQTTAATAIDSFARRALDILASAFGLLFLLPVFAILAYFIKRDSPGPVFYRGPRVGKNGKPFGILKLRTMYEKPECYQGPRVTAAGDTRITALGHWLRDTKINELPQLWNVFTGEMALVGPRPEDPEIASGWPAALREQILSVRPGITSPATVLYRGEEEMLQSANVMDDYLRTILPNKLRLDSIYVRNRSILSDLDVIFMTFVLLLPRIRRSQVPETMLYWGPLAQFVSRYLNWFCLDTLVAFGAIVVTSVLWRLDAPLNLGLARWIAISMSVSLCFGVTNSLLGLTRIQWRRAPASEIIPLALSAIIATAWLILVDTVFFHQGHLQTTRPHLPLGVMLNTGMLSFFGFAMIRYRERLLTGLAAHWLRARGVHSAVGERVLLVGAGNNSQLAVWLLTRSDFARAFSIVGIVDDDPRKQGMYYDGYPVLGTTRQIPDLAARHDIGLVLFTIGNIDEAERQKILKTCRGANAQLVVLPDLMADLRARFVTVRQADPNAQNLIPTEMQS